MRIVVTGDQHDEEVIAEPFEIEGSGEVFAVHPAIGGDDRGAWSATHVDTGLSIARGDTIDEAIAAGRSAWNSKSPAEIAAAKARGAAIRAARVFASQVTQ